ncbi:hypothetical protein D3C77_461070 [compost metagenome]
MRTDNNIDRTIFNTLNRFILLLTTTETTQGMNLERISREPLTERFKVLLCQYRRRH